MAIIVLNYCNFVPHSGQNFGIGCPPSGVQPQPGQPAGAADGFFAPQFVQKLPLLTAPHEQVQLLSAGLGEPHSGQKFPVTVAPQAHFQEFAAAAGDAG